MAVKYVRDDLRESAPGKRGRFDRPMRKTPSELRGRLRLIYLGVAAFTVIMYLAWGLGYLKPQEWRAAKAGLGEIVAKGTVAVAEGEERPTIEIAFVNAEGQTDRSISEVVIVDGDTAAALQVGDRVEMRYQLSRDGTRLRVETIEP